MVHAINEEISVKRTFFVFLIVHFLLCATLFGEEKVTTILLIRHAEKATTPAEDPVLTPQGTARADGLVQIFENSGLTAIYTSQYARTRLSAEPLARKLGVKAQTVNADATNELVKTIFGRHSGETVLVIGHSNTLPEIVQALGAGKIQEIADTD